MHLLPWLIAALIVLAGLGGALLRRRSTRLTELPPSAPATVEAAAAPARNDDAGDAVPTGPAAARAPAAADAVQAAAIADEPAVAAAPGPIDVPAPAAGRLGRLRSRLARSESAVGRGLLALLGGGAVDAATWQDVEDTLIVADVGAAAAAEIVANLKVRLAAAGDGEQAVRAALRAELIDALGDYDRSVATAREGRPAVILVVGVNGTGKTTTCGKLARLLVAGGSQVVLGAADTFRAAASEQLATWGARVGATTIRGAEGADPASVAFDAVRSGIDAHADVVLIDTAGRLHTKTGLMDELGKLQRVVERQAPVDEVLLVLDATTGQNGLVQARMFADVVGITGVVLTKLDGTARGGIVIGVQRELGRPVKLVGLGEGPDDLAPFEPGAFVDALLGGD